MTQQPNCLIKSVNKTFNVKAPDELHVQAFSNEATHPAIPAINPHYVFRKEDLRDVLAFLDHPQGDALYITGATGCGKTSLINQVAARLNWPVQTVTVHGRLELMDLLGHLSLKDGSMQFVEGALTQAVRHGHLFILNEMDLADPAELAGLNDLLEGAPLVLTQNGGEIIYPHPKFRLIATGNSVGSGDTTGLYQGVMQQNLAFLDRFRLLEVSYAQAKTEEAILARAVPELPTAIAQGMVTVANHIRRLFLGNPQSKQDAELTVTLSTRTLIRWARLTLTFKGAPNALEYALIRALTARAEPQQRQAIHRIAQDVFGQTCHNAHDSEKTSK